MRGTSDAGIGTTRRKVSISCAATRPSSLAIFAASATTAATAASSPEP